MYVVKLIKVPTRNDFRDDYCPRRFRYKADALELCAEVDHKGGEAVVEKVEPAVRTRPVGGI